MIMFKNKNKIIKVFSFKNVLAIFYFFKLSNYPLKNITAISIQNLTVTFSYQYLNFTDNYKCSASKVVRHTAEQRTKYSLIVLINSFIFSYFSIHINK